MPASAIRLNSTASLHRLRSFAVVAEVGSLTRAALQLDTDVANLSRQISAFESQCGIRLFDRTGRGVRLNEVGRRLFPDVMALLFQAQQLEENLRDSADELRGEVTIALMPSMASTIVGPLFELLHKFHPEVRLKIMEGASSRVEGWLADGYADIGLLYRYTSVLPPGETALSVTSVSLVGALGDIATAKKTVPFHTLASIPLVLPSVPNGLRNELDIRARELRLKLRPVLESESFSLLKELATKQRLNVILSPHSIVKEVSAGELQISKIIDPEITAITAIALSKTKAPGRAVKLVAKKINSIVTQSN